MKGIILAGGTGSRLRPLTKVTNKHLLPVYNKPMIHYPLGILVYAGITEVMVVSGKGHAGHFLELLGSGKDMGVNLSYEVQEEAGGIAQALGLTQNFAQDDDVAVILGDNIFTDREAVKSAVSEFKGGGHIFLKEVPDPSRFGVPTLEGETVVKIDEKPEDPATSFAVTGLYLYDKDVYSVVKNLKPSDRGELEITDVNNEYIKKGSLRSTILQGDWTDAGTFESLLRANILAARSENELDESLLSK
ncbi:MAG: NTP transferase domain-containing protein [Candidatus Jacksonbacteria bacterium]|jgi:glucose-1-phosphate thymidylyltransferase|nr:NTP transferase domain-containing protein [Candidatus Jacksonbacteria bacterium]MBT6034052.1 NTP transferase domain-containing protein [Candidatus Jacksonbacteria bacterium]MBT6301532.1 NTP transferase domain-containing protein [Candidatus Jacksonbacteria bacterium]MBT6757583.1 NTP transferase domain-containing protein [Candidatus Jacksonbacteria bacterium]MBT6955313.1 NTP transferase domain-containing protein [Candidatus Jacksonbacteria bacterium]